MSEIDVSCLPKDLPEFIEVDLSKLEVHQTVRVLDITLPAGVTAVLKGKENPVLVSVTTHGEQTEEEEAAAAGAPVSADVPATAQKAPVAATAAEPAKAEKGAAKPRREEKGGDKKR
jgi:large subunit ribosomal protein L25